MKKALPSIFALLISSFIWAVAFIPTRYLGQQGVSPFSEIFVRYLVPAVILGAFFYTKMNISKLLIARAVLTGSLLWIALVFAIYGVRSIAHGSMGLLLVTLYVLIVPFASAIIYKHRPSSRLIICAVFCFAGLALLIVGKPLGTPNIGTLLCFLASIFYASYLLLSNAILDDSISPVALHFYQSITAVALCIPCMLFIENISLYSIIRTTNDLPPLLTALAFTGFCSGLIAYQLLFYAQSRLTPTLVVIILSTKNVFGAILDISIFNVPITGIQYIAYGVVIVATAVASIAPRVKK